MDESKELRIVYDNPPAWMLNYLNKFRGKVQFITSAKIKGKDWIIKVVPNVKSKFIIFDNAIMMTINDNDETAIIDSCIGCIIQGSEHFELQWKLTE
ncbi:hypothetical protein [Acidianus sp. RZ1]|uniref:hypothetical protein n=1 Tax=Acidianus sp. RZ1 TaxID=1540082 RepID=UPI00149110BA|nr:hypothetical protein [Acidianus sp. RZ1]NON62281.1 hypothetical protein [Acidianus sp. RZ1]